MSISQDDSLMVDVLLSQSVRYLARAEVYLSLKFS